MTHSDEKRVKNMMRHRNAGRKYPTYYDWGKVDWSLQDTVIARAVGCSREAVRTRRKKLGIPPPPTAGKKTVILPSPTMVKTKELGIDPSKYDVEGLAHTLGVCNETIKRNFPEIVKTKRYDWSILTADACSTLDDKEIARKVGCSVYAVRNKRLSMGIVRKRGRHMPGTHPIVGKLHGTRPRP